MNFRHLTLGVAVVIFLLSTSARSASPEDSISLDAILGRWYPTNPQVIGASPFLNIAEGSIIIEGSVIFKTTPIGDLKGYSGRKALGFQVTGETCIDEKLHMCSSAITYIKVDMAKPDPLDILYGNGNLIFVYFCHGEKMISSGGEDEFSQGCAGGGFRRK